MAINESSIADAIRSAVRDAQDLVRGEIALAKAEAREEVSRLGMGAALLAAAALAAVLGVVFLLATIAWAIAEGLAWPVWAGLGIVTLLTLMAAAVLGVVGRGRLKAARYMPRTVDTMKENMQWMRARTP
jgi:uncharacterized membrane protein YqjE